MKEQTITVYTASDGREFRGRLECLDHERLLQFCEVTFAGLKPTPKEHGTFVRQDPVATKAAVLQLARECQKYTPASIAWVQQYIDYLDGKLEPGKAVHSSWPNRIISECCPEPLQKAFWRVACISDDFSREYQQPYFCDHPEEAKEVSSWT